MPSISIVITRRDAANAIRYGTPTTIFCLSFFGRVAHMLDHPMLMTICVTTSKRSSTLLQIRIVTREMELFQYFFGRPSITMACVLKTFMCLGYSSVTALGLSCLIRDVTTSRGSQKVRLTGKDGSALCGRLHLQGIQERFAFCVNPFMLLRKDF